MNARDILTLERMTTKAAMKTRKALLGLVVALAAASATESALARPRSHVHLGFHFGIPVGGYHYWGPRPYYYHPYPYYAAPIVVQQQPITYIEQAPAPALQAPVQPQGYWYYCADSRAYYPYVKDCPAGWQRVSPQPN
jgi:hypothetical protein